MKFKYLLLVAFIATLSSCETNENPDLDITSADLLGVWNVTGFTFDASTTATIQNSTITSTSTSFGKNYDFIYTFSENPNTVSAVGSYTSVITTSIPNRQAVTQEITVNSIDGLDSGSWSLDGNVITFVDNNNKTSKAEITSFSQNKLILKQFIDEAQNVNGASVTIKAEGIITLEK